MEKNARVYVVTGSTGEYSDRREHVVCVFTTEAAAREHVEKAEAFAREWWVKNGDDYYNFKRPGISSPYDHGFDVDNTGPTNYEVSEVELDPTPLGQAAMARA